MESYLQNHTVQSRHAAPTLRAIAQAAMLTAALAAISASAAAQVAQADAPPAPVQVVTITAEREAEQNADNGRGAASIASKALPSNVVEVTAEDIAGINVGRDISNVFRRVPGVVANNIDQGDTGNGFRMRGFATQGTHGADTAVYVDGVPQNIPSSQGGAGHGPVFLEWMTPDMIGAIDVIKGPISALYGDQNRAGAVNIATATGGAAVPSSVAVTAERYGGRRAALTLSGQYQGIDSLFVADRYHADSFRDAAHNSRKNLFWKLSTQYDGGVYSLRASYYASGFSGAGYLSMPAMEAGLDPRSVQFNLPGFGDAHRRSLVFNRSPAAGEAGWHATVYAERFERSRAIATSAALHTYGYDERDIAGARLARNWTLGDDASIIVGAETRKDQGDALRRQYRARVPTANYVNNQHLDLLTYGLFAQAQYRLTPTLKLHGGARIDRFDYELLNRKLPNASTGYRHSVLTPKYGALWTVRPGVELFANVAQGFRSPAAEQISSSGSLGPLGAAGGTINAGIAPSKVKSHDLGFNAKPWRHWSVSGTAYYITNDDEIVNTAPDVYASAGQTTRRGVELDLRYETDNNVSAYASYGRILRAQADNPAPGTGALLSIPAHQYKAGAQYRQPLGGGTLRLNGDVYVTARNPYYSGSPSVVRAMPTYVRYDVKATYDYGKYQVAVFGVVQPHKFASDVAYGTAAGLLVSTMAQHQYGAMLKYFF